MDINLFIIELCFYSYYLIENCLLYFTHWLNFAIFCHLIFSIYLHCAIRDVLYLLRKQSITTSDKCICYLKEISFH